MRAAASTFRQNPALDTERVITELGIGEALVSMLEDKGVPGIVERCLVCPPRSRIGPADERERTEVMSRSPVSGRYDQAVDRDSAHEMLARRAEKIVEQREPDKPRRSSGGRQSYGEAVTKSILRSLGSTLGRSLGKELLRGILGGVSRR